jgi:ABC-type transport system involved in cytochrome c biogenesis permease component
MHLMDISEEIGPHTIIVGVLLIPLLSTERTFRQKNQQILEVILPLTKWTYQTSIEYSI